MTTVRATDAPTTDATQQFIWRGVILTAAIALSLRTAWHIWIIRPDYERVVAREGLPPLYALVILGAGLMNILAAYIASATLWLRRRWAPRAMVGYAIAVAVSRAGVRAYFTRGHDVPLFTPNEWALLASLVIVTIGGAVLVDRALNAVGGVELTGPVPPVPRWENWITIAAAIPPILFAGHMLLLGDSVTEDADSGNLARLLWFSYPVILLLLKRVIDGFYGLRPEPRLVVADPEFVDGLKPGTYVSPQSLAEALTTRAVARVLEAPDGVARTLRTRGLNPPKAPPEYPVELLLYGTFIHDVALERHAEPLAEETRRHLRETTRAAANTLLIGTERSEFSPESWAQLVERRFNEYASDASQAELDDRNKDRHLTSLCTKVFRYASKSHVPSPRAVKVLLEFFPAELSRTRKTLSQCVLVSDAG